MCNGHDQRPFYCAGNDEHNGINSVLISDTVVSWGIFSLSTITFDGSLSAEALLLM